MDALGRNNAVLRGAAPAGLAGRARRPTPCATRCAGSRAVRARKGSCGSRRRPAHGSSAADETSGSTSAAARRPPRRSTATSGAPSDGRYRFGAPCARCRRRPAAGERAALHLTLARARAARVKSRRARSSLRLRPSLAAAGEQAAALEGGAPPRRPAATRTARRAPCRALARAWDRVPSRNAAGETALADFLLRARAAALGPPARQLALSRRRSTSWIRERPAPALERSWRARARAAQSQPPESASDARVGSRAGRGATAAGEARARLLAGSRGAACSTAASRQRGDRTGASRPRSRPHALGGAPRATRSLLAGHDRRFDEGAEQRARRSASLRRENLPDLSYAYVNTRHSASSPLATRRGRSRSRSWGSRRPAPDRDHVARLPAPEFASTSAPGGVRAALPAEALDRRAHR